MGGGEPVASDRLKFGQDGGLDVLLADWQAARDDERTFALVLATLFGVAIPIIAGASSFLFKTCPRHSTNCSELPHWSFALLPLIPMLVLGFWVMSAAIAVMRGYYIRALEEELATRGVDVHLGEYGTVRSPGLTKLLLPLVSHKRGLFPYVVVFPLLFATAFLLAAGVTGVSVWKTDSTSLRLGAGITYAIFLGVLGLVPMNGGLRARLLLPRLVGRYEFESTFDAAQEHEPGRGLVSYLLLPRPLDVVKTAFIGGGVLLAFFLHGATPRPPIWALVVFVFAFELFVYQARYMRNDFADRWLDAEHPGASSRRRAAGLDQRSRLAAFEVVFFVRLLGAAVVATFLWLRVGTRLGAAFIVGSFLVWTIGVVYERVKDRARKFRPPPPLFSRARPQRVLFVWVGAGYGVRTALGVFIGSEVITGTFDGVTATCVLLVWGVAFGSMFVAMTWALEASSFVSRDGERYDIALEDRADRGALAIEAGLLRPDARAVAVLDGGGSDGLQAIVSSSSLRATWNVSLVIAMVLSALVGVILASDWRASGAAYAVGFGAAAASAVFVAVPLLLRLRVMWLLVAGIAASGVTTACAVAAGTTHAWIACVPAAAVTLTYVSFRTTTYTALLHPFAPLKPLLATSGAALERGLLGSGVLDSLVKAAKPISTSHSALRPSSARRRVVRVVIDRDALAETLARCRPAAVVVDLEPLVCEWGSDESALRDGLNDLFQLVASVGTVTQVIVATNSRRTVSDMPDAKDLSTAYISRAGKPWLPLSSLGTLSAPTVVVGDQILTDGLLAWRLQASFVQLRLPRGTPQMIRVQSTIGALLSPLLFRAVRL